MIINNTKKKRLPSNWRKRIEFTEEWYEGKQYKSELESFLEIKIEFKKGKNPKGFDRYIGYIKIKKDKNKYWIDESDVWKELQGRGLGKTLYLMALERCGSITTQYHHASEQAQYVWKSLMKKYKFKTDFFKGTLTVWNKEKTAVSH